MVKDVVKSECRMIAMWSSFFGVAEALKNLPPAEKKNAEKVNKYIKSREETNQLTYVVNLISGDDKHVVRH